MFKMLYIIITLGIVFLIGHGIWEYRSFYADAYEALSDIDKWEENVVFVMQLPSGESFGGLIELGCCSGSFLMQ